MAALLADQNFEDEVVAALIALGHDIATVRSLGLDSSPDQDVLAAATQSGRCFLTHDRDYIRLHKSGISHAGVVFATTDKDSPALAARIHAAITSAQALAGQLIRIVRPNPPKVP